MKTLKGEIILYGKKCECGRFVDFSKVIKQERKETEKRVKDNILLRLPKEVETNNKDDDYVRLVAGGYNTVIKEIKDLLR